MKKILSFVILIIALSSCSDDIKFNNEAVFQGVKDNVFWTGTEAKAEITGNSITISSVGFLETMALKIPIPTGSINPTNEATFLKYVLGTSTTQTATYTFSDDVNDYFYETAINVGDGQVTVSEYDGVYISGSFRFNAKNTDPDSDAPEIVNVQSGVFYKVPVVQEAL